MLQVYESWQEQQQRHGPSTTDVIQATMLMVLPVAIDCRLQSNFTKGASAMSNASGQPAPRHLVKPQHLGPHQGLGYSRLCNQLVAYGSGLEAIWLLDDNIWQCFRMEHPSKHNEQGDQLNGTQTYKSKTVRQITLSEAMQTIEAAVLPAQALVRQHVAESMFTNGHVVEAGCL